MENNLRQRLRTSPEDVGLSGARVDEIECRSTMCRLVLDYPSSVFDTAVVKGFPFPRFRMWDVYRHAANVGLLATGSNVDFVEESANKRKRETLILYFDGDSLDPERYPAWSGADAERMKRSFEKYVQEVQEKKQQQQEKQ
jgi:hypothetical protein